MSVTFVPTAGGVRQNFLTVADNAPGGSTVVELMGVGSDFVLLTNPPTSLTVTPGQAANFSLVVGSEFGFGQSVLLSCAGVPQATCTVTPSLVTPPSSGNPPDCAGRCRNNSGFGFVRSRYGDSSKFRPSHRSV